MNLGINHKTKERENGVEWGKGGEGREKSRIERQNSINSFSCYRCWVE